jgi:hypothetical protein
MGKAGSSDKTEVHKKIVVENLGGERETTQKN